MSEVELEHDLNHWIVSLEGSLIQLEVGLQVLWSNPCPQRRPSSSLDWLAQGQTPLSFEHIQGANSLASQCWITVMVKTVSWYCSVSCCNVLVLGLFSSGAFPQPVPVLHYGVKALRRFPWTLFLNKNLSLRQLLHRVPAPGNAGMSISHWCVWTGCC